MTNETNTSENSFFGLGIAPGLMEALDRLKFKTPTPIQKQSIPVGIEGKDLVGIAQTGTGKTIAFALPMIQRLASGQGMGLVILPTRELAIQVNDVFKQFAPALGINTSVLIGGESIRRQQQDLRRRPRVIIATPGRLIDHMTQNTVKLGTVSVLVLDEADRMFDMGFAPQLNRIMAAVPKERQTMLYSATMPDTIMKLASAHMKLPVRVEVAKSGTAAEKVEQELFFVTKNEKPDLLLSILDKYWGSVLLFVRTKYNAARITKNLRTAGHNSAEIHSNRSLAQRRDALEGFKTGRYRVLVATDIAARGIDVNGIELVINYDLPDEHENYVHRIGRTGRAGKAGRAITFASPDQSREVREIERLIRMALPRGKRPEAKAGAAAKAQPVLPGQENQVKPAPAPVEETMPEPKPVEAPRTQRVYGAPRPGADRPYARPQRSYGDRPQRPSSDRPVIRPPQARPYGDRPQRPSYGDRPQRPYSDRPSRPYGDRPQRPSSDRPVIRPPQARPYGDRPQRPFSDRRPANAHGPRPSRPPQDRPSYNDRPRRPYSAGPEGRSGERSSVVSRSAYFDEPRQGRPDNFGNLKSYGGQGGRRPHRGEWKPSGPRPSSRNAEPKGAAAPNIGWFSRFMKKKG